MNSPGFEDSVMARSVYVSIYRRRWGCAAALEHARLRLARRTFVPGTTGAREAATDAGTFDPGDFADVCANAAEQFGGPPHGQAQRAG